MKQVNFYEYYSFGYNYYILSNSCNGMTYKRVLAFVKDFFNNLKEFELEVTLKVAEELEKFCKRLKKKDKDAIITDNEVEKIEKIIIKLDPTLDAEMQLRKAYVLLSKRQTTSNLLETPSNMFAEDVYSKLTILAQYDFKESFKCLAFQRATASAFHCLRATEDMTKALYCYYVRQKRLKILMWYPMLEALRKKKTNKPPKQLLDHLDIIRKNFRNPTQHPEKVYDIDEAHDLVNNCISAVNSIIKKIGDQSNN